MPSVNMKVPKLVKWKHQIKVPKYEQGKTVQIYAQELQRGLGELAEAMLEKFLVGLYGKMPIDDVIKDKGRIASIGLEEYTYYWDGKEIITVKLVQKRTLLLIEGEFL